MIKLDDLLAKDLLPDAAIRLGIRRLLAQKLRAEDRGDVENQQRALLDFVRELMASPIAVQNAAANEHPPRESVSFIAPARFRVATWISSTCSSTGETRLER